MPSWVTFESVTAQSWPREAEPGQYPGSGDRSLLHLGRSSGLRSSVGGLANPFMTAPTLNLKAIGWSWDIQPMNNRKVYQYAVQELPLGHRAMVANFGGPHREQWRIFHERNGAHGQWEGNYRSAEEALAVIQGRIASKI